MDLQALVATGEYIFTFLSEGEFLFACCGILFNVCFQSFFLLPFEFSLRYIIQT
jgi:hypothetical protein